MFNVGDLVKIKEELVLGVCGATSIVDRMLRYKGKTTTIVKCISTTDGVLYLLQIDDGLWNWPEDALEIVPEFKIGDVVRIREDLIPNTMYGDVYFTVDMSDYRDKITKITFIGSDGECMLDIDGGSCWWDSSMLLPVCSKCGTLEQGSNRLAKAVCEYEEIIHNTETELKDLKLEYCSLIDKYNTLVEKYNSLLNDMMEDYV